MSPDDYIKTAKNINDEVQQQSNTTLHTLSLGGLVNAQSLTLLNNTQNQYASQALANAAMVATCDKILRS
jgi:hypothetical protein